MILYVNANASRDGHGSRAMPFKHIDEGDPPQRRHGG